MLVSDSPCHKISNVLGRMIQIGICATFPAFNALYCAGFHILTKIMMKNRGYYCRYRSIIFMMRVIMICEALCSVFHQFRVSLKNVIKIIIHSIFKKY